MSTSKNSTPAEIDPSYKDGARAQKIERLLPVFEAHVAAVTGLTGVFDPKNNLDDARLVAHNAQASLRGETVWIEARTPNGRIIRKETYSFWNTVADLAGIPDYRYPSIPTIKALARRCARRVKDIEETPDPFTGIVKLVAVAS